MKKISLLIIVFTTIMLSSSLFAQKVTQAIRGNLYDQESQAPIEGAYIVVQNGKPLGGSLSEQDGSYKITDIPLGRYSVYVTLVGYEPVTIPEVLVTSGKEVVLDIPMKQSVIEMNEVVVKSFSRKDRSINSMASVSAKTFTVEETRRYAGGIDDPARLVSAFAGVTVGSVSNNAIIIRGNSPKGVGWRLEGVDIPNPNHFAGGNVAGGGAVTVFSSQMLDNSDFYTGAFPSEYGNAMAGVFDMRLRNGNNEKFEHTFQIGTMGIDFASEGPIGKPGGASYLFNYRYSTLGLLTKSKIIETAEEIAYQDLSFKINMPTQNAGTFSLWAIGAYDEDAKPEDKDSAEWEFEQNRQNTKWIQGMAATGLSHKISLNKNFYLKSTLSASGISANFNIDRLDDELTLQRFIDIKDNSSKTSLSSTLNGKLSPKWAIRSGIIINQLNYNLEMHSEIDEVPGTYQLLSDEKDNSGYYQYFIASKYDITPYFSVNAGLHSLYFDLTDKYSIEPRLGIRLAAAENHEFSLGYGKHSQLEELRIYTLKQELNGSIIQPNKDLDFGKAHHFVFSYDWRLNSNMRLKIEPYFQYLYNMPGVKDSSYSMINFSQDFGFHYALENNSLGKNYGLDITLERFLKNNFYYLITASVFDSKFQGDDKKWHDTRFNKRYSINFLAGKEFYTQKDNILGFNLRANFLGGERHDGVNETASIQAQRVITDFTKVYTERYPDNFFLDLSITYRINKAKRSSTIAFQVKNVLNKPSVFGKKYNYMKDIVENEELQIMVPVLSYKVDF